MKKITLVVLLLAFSWQINAQDLENNDFIKRNELKLDVTALLSSKFQVEYEYLLNDWSSMGAVVMYNFSNSFFMGLGWPVWKSQVLGTYKLYFGKIPATGFFLEGNFGVISGNKFEGNIWSEKEPYTAFGVGIAVGWKWHIPKSGITLDLNYGAGRLIENNDPALYLRAGLCVGKRF